MTRRAGAARLRVSPVVIIVGLLSSGLLAFSSTATFSGFSASLTDTGSHAGTGTLNMQETDSTGAVICSTDASTSTNTSSCSTIDVYGAESLSPGTAGAPTSVTIADTGTLAPSTFTLDFGSCSTSPSSGPDLCTRLQLEVTCQAAGSGAIHTVSTGRTLAELADDGPLDLGSVSAACVPHAASANTVTFTFTVSMQAGTDNRYQGRTASQSLTWQFTGA